MNTTDHCTLLVRTDGVLLPTGAATPLPHLTPGVITGLCGVAQATPLTVIPYLSQPQAVSAQVAEWVLTLLRAEHIHIPPTLAGPAPGLEHARVLTQHAGNIWVIGTDDTDRGPADAAGLHYLDFMDNPWGSPLLFWEKLAAEVALGPRRAEVQRNTRETQIHILLDLDGSGQSQIRTGLGFLDHMLDQIARHSGMDLNLTCQGDLHVDEHHTVEDCALALGQALHQALGHKRGLERYGFVLPMDEARAEVALDLGGRPYLVWEARFTRERVGDVPTELWPHFFKSLTDTGKFTLHIRATADNDHHLIESIFKGVARALRMALHRNPLQGTLPSTKGVL